MHPRPPLPLAQYLRSTPVLSGTRCNQVLRTFLLLCNSSSGRIDRRRNRDTLGLICVLKDPSYSDPDVVVDILEQQLKLLHDRAIRFPGLLLYPIL